MFKLYANDAVKELGVGAAVSFALRVVFFGGGGPKLFRGLSIK